MTNFESFSKPLTDREKRDLREEVKIIHESPEQEKIIESIRKKIPLLASALETIGDYYADDGSGWYVFWGEGVPVYTNDLDFFEKHSRRKSHMGRELNDAEKTLISMTLDASSTPLFTKEEWKIVYPLFEDNYGGCEKISCHFSPSNVVEKLRTL
jgi:hypothetical protein